MTNSQPVRDFYKLVDFVMGKVMKENPRFNPKLTRELIIWKLIKIIWSEEFYDKFGNTSSQYGQ